MRVVLGGTFDPLHAGHRRLLQHALNLAGKNGSLHIGLVTDEYSKKKRDRQTAPYDERKKRLHDWIHGQDPSVSIKINPLSDPFGPSATGDYDAIVASAETTATAHKVNEERKRRGLGPLQVETVPYALAQDLLPISATRIAQGRIDEDGRRLLPLIVAVGSENPVKLRATQNALKRHLGRIPLEVLPVKTKSGVPAQPQETQAAEGARHRAQSALEHAAADGAEYGIGIEAGIVRDPYSGLVMDVQHCFIVDPTGFASHGHGSGFTYPPEVARRVLEEDITISQAFEPLTGDPRLGRYEGAVGWLTHGVLDRTRLTEQAVEAALVPRIRRGLYEATPSR